jgi:sarcinarray family protein
MKFKTSILILTLLFLNFQIASAAENEYGIVKAWFNGENATVNGLQLKIGEPVEVKVEIISKINGSVFVKIKEPGVTKAFDIKEGPSNHDVTIDNYDVTNGWSKTYFWTLTPNGAWKNGNAPINIFVQFDKIVNGKIKGDKTIQFTIANPYILGEQYTGAATTTTEAPEITETGAPSAKEAPFLPLIFTVSTLLLAWRLKKIVR